MIRRPTMCRVAVVALFAIAMVIVIQPLGVFWHVVHDHLGGTAHTARDGIALQVEDADAPDHDAGHCHMWMTPAAAVVSPRVGQPHAIAALGIFEDAPAPSAAPFPPFSPPRA